MDDVNRQPAVTRPWGWECSNFVRIKQAFVVESMEVKQQESFRSSPCCNSFGWLVVCAILAAAAADRNDNHVRIGRWDSDQGWARTSLCDLTASTGTTIACGRQHPRKAVSYYPGIDFNAIDANERSSPPFRRLRNLRATRLTGHTRSTRAAGAAATPAAGDDPQLKDRDELERESESHNFSSERILTSLTQPLIDIEAWDRLTGDEFIADQTTDNHDNGLLDRFTTMCQQLASSERPSDWIEWTEHGKHASVEDGHINIWVGRAIRREYCGSHLPIIKSRSIVPLTPLELVELLLDSSRVQTYNKWSIGRSDVWVKDALTKIVKNRTKPPVGSKPMVSITIMHARPVQLSSALQVKTTKNDDAADSNGNKSWIVVSRAIGGKQFCDAIDADCGRSDILLGINLLEPYDDDSSLVTAITHVQSSVVPTMLAEKLGVKGAKQFVKDLRSLRPQLHVSS